MSVAASLIPELAEVIQSGSPERRAATLKRVTAFFLDGADRFNEAHVRLFDQVLGRLIAEIEAKARMELSFCLAPVGNAPVEVVRRLAQDEDIAIAGPVLRRSRRLAEIDLIEIARTRSQAHLLAISGRAGIAEPVTDVLVRRGDRGVALRVAENSRARLSDDGFSALLKRAEMDDVLAEKLGLRPNIPRQHFRNLLLKATEVVQQRLLVSSKPEKRSEIRRVLDEAAATARPHDYWAAQSAIETLRQEGKLDEAALVDFAKNARYAETVAALAALCAVPIGVVDRLMGGGRPDPVLILSKSAGWGWATAKAILMSRPGGPGTSSHGLDMAFANFDRLSVTTAQRVKRFWQVRKTDDR